MKAEVHAFSIYSLILSSLQEEHFRSIMKTKSCKTGNRQLLKSQIIALIFMMATFPSYGQSSKSKIVDYANVDYSQASNILDPDTLTQDRRAIFFHFVKLTHDETKNLEPLKIKAEFAKLGIKTTDRTRFVAAYSFYSSSMTNHKKSCEQWESFKDLAPK
jgi:hypothetical protein